MGGFQSEFVDGFVDCDLELGILISAGVKAQLQFGGAVNVEKNGPDFSRIFQYEASLVSSAARFRSGSIDVAGNWNLPILTGRKKERQGECDDVQHAYGGPSSVFRVSPAAVIPRRSR